MAGFTACSSPVAVVAHRGASADAPENTLPAFELAWEQGADAIEGDFWLTADGEVACCHDADTKKVAGRKVEVRAASFADLQGLDVGRWKGERWTGTAMPRLADVLATVPPGKRMFIEIKDGPHAVPAVARAVRASGLTDDQVRVIAFDAEVVAAAKAALPGVKAYWLVNQKKARQLGPAGVVATAKAAEANGVSTEAGEAPWPALVDTVTGAGLEIHTWTIDDPQKALAFARAGYQSITTNRPGPVGAALRESR
jgi:glycerophosphoryl diester phosphodiesterase